MSSLGHSDKKKLSIQTNPFPESGSIMRGRGSSRAENIEMGSISANASPAEPFHETALSGPGPSLQPASPNKLRATSLLQRLSSLRSPVAPMSTRFSNRRARAKHYDTLDEDEADEDYNIGIDLSSLAGLGFQLTDPMDPGFKIARPMPPLESSANNTLIKDPPDVKIENADPQLGKGMVVGAQLKLDPSSAVVQRAVSSRLSLNPNTSMDIARAKSIRDIGQNLAQQRQVIVAVNETVDLSTLEGNQGRQRASHQSFEAMASTIKATDGGPQSYFYPTDPEHPNWKPFSMSSIYILLLTVVSLGMGIFQEWLCRHSQDLVADGQGILHFDKASDIPVGNFFAWKYLPTLIFVVYGVLWQIMDFDIKRLEPYYQLSQPTGSTAAASLNLDHLTAWSYFVPFKAIKLKQWAVFFSAIGNILATSVAPSLQNPSVTFVRNPQCPLDQPGSQCPPGYENLVLISPAWSRALTSSLVVTAAFGAILLVQLRRKSGLLSDPKGIAGVAAMATKSHILNDFQGMDTATRRQIHKKLQHRRFVLYKSSIWQGEWNRTTEPLQESVAKSEYTHPLMLRMQAAIPFVLYMVLCLFSIPIINLTSARVIPNAAPWLPVLFATLIKMLWTTFESDVRLMEPFYILSKGNAPPEQSLTLDYQGTVYGWFPIKAMLNGHFLLTLVGISSIGLDLLTVTVSSFSVNSKAFLHGSNDNISNQDETFRSFWASVIISIAILLFVIFTAVLVYLRRRHPFLPREPSTIAAILAFIFASKMLDDFIDTERFSSRQMEALLQEKGKRYGLGWFRGRDGKVHCAIDEEPMRSRYVHGAPYPWAMAPWERGDDPAFP